MPITPQRRIQPEQGFMVVSNKARSTLTIDPAAFDDPINELRYDNERETAEKRRSEGADRIGTLGAPLIGFSLWRNSADVYWSPYCYPTSLWNGINRRRNYDDDDDNADDCHRRAILLAWLNINVLNYRLIHRQRQYFSALLLLSLPSLLNISTAFVLLRVHFHILILASKDGSNVMIFRARSDNRVILLDLEITTRRNCRRESVSDRGYKGQGNWDNFVVPQISCSQLAN